MGISESIKRGLRLLSETFEEGMDFGKKNFLGVIKYLVVSSLAMLGIGAAGGILAAIAYLGIRLAASSLAPGAGETVNIFAMASAAVIALAGIVAGYTYSLAANLGAVQYIYSGKKRGYFEGENVGVAFGWSAFIVGALVLLVIGVLGGVYAVRAIAPGSPAIILLILGVAGIAVAGAILLAMAFYYSRQELAVNKRGPLEAIGASWELVKGNFWETVVFGLMLYILSEIAMGIPSFFLSLGMQLGMGLMALGPILIAVGVAVLGVFLIAMIAVGFLVEAGALILKVKFYKKIAGGDGGAKTRKAS